MFTFLQDARVKSTSTEFSSSPSWYNNTPIKGYSSPISKSQGNHRAQAPLQRGKLYWNEDVRKPMQQKTYLTENGLVFCQISSPAGLTSQLKKTSCVSTKEEVAPKWEQAKNKARWGCSSLSFSVFMKFQTWTRHLQKTNILYVKCVCCRVYQRQRGAWLEFSRLQL